MNCSRAACSPTWSRKGCRWASAEAEWRALEAAIAAQPEGKPLQVNPFVHAVLSDDPLRIRRGGEHYARFFAGFVKPLPPLRHVRMAGRCASPTCRPISSSTPPRS